MVAGLGLGVFGAALATLIAQGISAVFSFIIFFCRMRLYKSHFDWLEHKGAWYIAMLIPLYAITPVHDAICKKIKNPVYYTLVIVIIIVGISSLHFECPNVGLS